MSPFGRKSDTPRQRTPEERERERLERERRRAERAGLPSEPQPLAEPAAAADVTDPAHMSEPSLPPEPLPVAPEPVPVAPEPVPVAAPVAPEPVAAAQPEVAPIARTRADAVAHAAARGVGGRRGDGDGSTGADAPRDGRPGLRHLPQLPRRHAAGTGTSRGWRRFVPILALLFAIAAVWFLVSLFQPFHGGGNGRVVVDIPRGASAGSIGDLLARKHVVSSSFMFSLRTTLEGKRGSFHAGEYVLKRDMSYSDALAALSKTAPQPVTAHVLLPEGYTRAQIAALARADGLTGDYLHASTRNGNLDTRTYGAPAHLRSLEGFLFPATYDLLPRSPVTRLVSLQLAAFKRNFATVDLRYARHRHLTAYDVLTVASMVEREAALAKERPVIAAVIYNRLHLRMPLGIDATIRYVYNDYTQPLTAAQLASRSPYNTRLRLGLPPTPIGNPGLASIQAAAHPAAVPYLYYVVKPGTCGQHAFSTTNAQFQLDVARYNSARAKAGGRSPTTCH